MTAERWTAETEELVARTIAAVDRYRCDDVDEVWRSYREAARAALQASADAGLLVEPGSRRVEQLDHAHGGEPCTGSRCMGPGSSTIRRVVLQGPWREVTEEAKP